MTRGTLPLVPPGPVVADAAGWPVPEAWRHPAPAHDPTPVPHVVAWNLTRRCNLACAHCYIAAGPWHESGAELTTAECRRIADEILAVSPAPLFILSGGEPLLRDDLEDIAAHMTSRGATVVVGTNGTRLTDARIASLKAAGVTGFAISIDSLDARYHDRFRHGEGALADTVAAVDRLKAHCLDFIVQTTITRGNRRELGALARWAADHGAVSFNVYFLVATGRGDGMRGLEPHENEAALREILALEREYRGRMMVRSKCQPQIMRLAYEAVQAETPDSRLQTLLNYGTRCPCGVNYCRITPEGRLTPCPYTPVVAGDLRALSFGEIWRESPVLRALREGEPSGRCGRCEYRRVCGGCRARAHADSGDLLGPDDSCAYEPTGDAAVIEPPRAVVYGAPVDARSGDAMPWSPEAEARLKRVPGFVRAVVADRLETFARERGAAAVTPELMDEVRRALPVDFSKRAPFFLRGSDPEEA